MEKYLLVMAGAAVGGLGRYLLYEAFKARFPERFWFGTVLVNITGCFLIGLVLTTLNQRNANPNWRLLLVVGMLGGYTTFSSFAFETYGLIKDGDFGKGLLNVAVSVIAGYIAVWFGALVARR